MSHWLLAAVAGLAIAAALYAWRERRLSPGPRLAGALLRGAAATLVVALLLDAPLAASRPRAPLVALDASESWRRAAGDESWRRALARVESLNTDSVLLFGDSVRAGSPPTRPEDRGTRARPVVERARAAGRPLVLLTDGELDDPDALAQLPVGSRVEVLAAAPVPDVALVDLELPRALVGGDTVEVALTLGAGPRGSGAGAVVVTAGTRTLARLPFDALGAGEERRLDARVRIDGDGALVVQAAAHAPGDREPRNDTLGVVVDVSPAAAAVFVSTSPDQDARYALAVLRGALSMPTRGYLRVAAEQWRVDGSLAPVSAAEVRRAVREAPLVVLHGDTAALGAPRGATRGALALVVPPEGPDGEWYAVAAPASPLAALLADAAWDSLPPLDVGRAPPRGEWSGLVAARDRGAERRVVVAGTERPRRVVVVAASGFWRWQVRGGAAASAFAALWGSIFDWLAAGRLDERAAVPVEGVLRAGEPVRWRRGGEADSAVRVLLRRRDDAARVDSLTLRFGPGAMVAESPPLEPGLYEATLRGGRALLVVNASREWLPRAATVRSGAVGRAVAAADERRVRDHFWPYALALALLCAEWLLRRRLGLR